MSCVADWVEAAFNMQQQWRSNATRPVVAYMGMTRDRNTAATVRSLMEALLMKQPNAGPAEPLAADTTGRPSLSVTSWVEWATSATRHW